MGNRFQEIYRTLLDMYGPQGWWPVTPPGKNKPEYHTDIDNERQRLEIMIGSILTQNTQWQPNVERAIARLHEMGLIDVDAIIDAEHEKIASAIKSSGYFNQKAKKLKRLAHFLKEHSIEGLRGKDTMGARKLLLGINGVGKETADSMILYALDKPIFVVDTYTRRMFSRYGLITAEQDYDEIQPIFTRHLESDSEIFKEYHALIVEHGKRYYSKKPFGEDDPVIMKEKGKIYNSVIILL